MSNRFTFNSQLFFYRARESCATSSVGSVNDSSGRSDALTPTSGRASNVDRTTPDEKKSSEKKSLRIRMEVNMIYLVMSWQILSSEVRCCDFNQIAILSNS